MALNIGHYRREDGHLSALEAFEEFLEMDVDLFAEEMKEQSIYYGSKMALFDILELWLLGGTGFIYCPTFQSFLLAVIEIREWMTHEKAPYWSQPGHEAVWQGRDTPIIEDGRINDSPFNGRLHPLLFEERFESLRQQREAAERHELHVHMDKILEHLGRLNPR